MSHLSRYAAAFALFGFSTRVQAQHLYWNYKNNPAGYNCLYGEVEVLATGPTVYYCGCNWGPGQPAGAYTGIQDLGEGKHTLIFSIWNTSDALKPKTIEKDPRTVAHAFDSEGSGEHSHLDYDWQIGKTYRYFVTKKQDGTGANTLCSLFFFDDRLQRWDKEATISSPNDGHLSVRAFQGTIASFLENWSGKSRAVPKLALYRLWMGTSPSNMINVTKAVGDGKWGTLDGAFYLAEGDEGALKPLFSAGSGWAVGKKAQLSVHARFLPEALTEELEKLEAN